MEDLPNWLTTILNDIAIAEDFVDFEINTENGCNKGDNFIGIVIRIVINGKKKNTSNDLVNETLKLICKLTPTNEARCKQFHVDAAFDRESLFYNEIAPLFLQFQRERGLNEQEMFHSFPKCYKAIHDEEQKISVIILQDLQPNGYTMWPKNRVVKVENARKVFRELAKFHAISFAMKDQCPEKISKYENLKDPIPKYFESSIFVDMNIKQFNEIIELFDEPEIKDIYKEFSKNVQKYYESCSDDSVPYKYRAIGHGDCWNNNILYKFDEVKYKNVYYIKIN